MSGLTASQQRQNKVYIIGLTGNIATGKSTVGQMLASLGARYIDADAIAHQVMAAGTPVYRAILAEFGPDIITDNDQIDRRRLGDLVFADPARLRRLEEIVHPAVIRRIGELLAQATEPVVVIDAIKLLESGLAGMCHAIWVVTCPQAQQVERLMRTRGLSKEEALLRIQAQPPQEEKVRLANVVIDNSGDLSTTWRQVKEAWERVQRALADA